MSRRTSLRTRQILTSYGILHTQNVMPHLSRIQVYEQPYTLTWYLTGFESDGTWRTYTVVYEDAPENPNGITFTEFV